MASKTNPGPYDCMAHALPDEEYFVLLARDPMAPWIVAIWASARVGDMHAAMQNFRLMFEEGLLQHFQQNPDSNKSEEAIKVAQRMRDWRQSNLGEGPGAIPSWKRRVIDLTPEPKDAA